MNSKLLLLLLALLPIHAQNTQLQSPEILPDRRVTFRLAAPNADQVGVFIDSMKANTQEPMAKNDDGVWSATLGPLPPGIYIYHFIVDGLNIADPVNPKIKLRARTSASLLEIPGDPSEYCEPRDVPHGTMHINFHQATALGGETREVWVYTPPGYELNSTRRYPVLYLLHGSNDTPAGWSTVGRANFTLDNLLADKKAREMIVVTPFGHAVPFGASRDSGRQNTPEFEQYLLKDVLPMIEKKYRVAPGRQNRAIAGFSMGGGHALHIGLGRLDLFSSVAALSAGVPQDFETRFASLLSDPQTTNRKLNLLWIACGKDDFLFEASQKLHATLEARGIRHTYLPTEGAHTFNVWRAHFAELAPLLFRRPPPAP